MALCSLLGICESSMQNNVVPSQVSQVNDGASTSSAREFVGFPVTPTQHVVVGHSIGAAFDVDDANGLSVTEVLAKDIRTYLHMVPDDRAMVYSSQYKGIEGSSF